MEYNYYITKEYTAAHGREIICVWVVNCNVYKADRFFIYSLERISSLMAISVYTDLNNLQLLKTDQRHCFYSQ